MLVPIMADVFLRRTLTGMVPSDGPSEEIWRKYKVGETYRAEITKPRNYKHHCLFMALLDLTFQSQDKYTVPRMFRRAVALEAGHVEQLITLDGEVRLIPLAYSYDEIPDEDNFTEAFGHAMAVCAKMLHDMKRDDLATEVARYASERYGVAA